MVCRQWHWERTTLTHVGTVVSSVLFRNSTLTFICFKQFNPLNSPQGKGLPSHFMDEEVRMTEEKNLTKVRQTRALNTLVFFGSIC